MEYIIGTVLALVITSGGTVLGFDRERVFYVAMMLVIASYYILFAAVGASSHFVIVELLVAVVFMLLAVIGYKTTLWLVVVALAGHGVLDLFHPLLVGDPGVPQSWPGFCMAFDIVAAGYLAGLLVKRPALVRGAP